MGHGTQLWLQVGIKPFSFLAPAHSTLRAEKALSGSSATICQSSGHLVEHGCGSNPMVWITLGTSVILRRSGVSRRLQFCVLGVQ